MFPFLLHIPVPMIWFTCLCHSQLLLLVLSSEWSMGSGLFLYIFLEGLCVLVKTSVQVNMPFFFFYVCVPSVCGGSTSPVWAVVITMLHCICRSQWSWTHCLSTWKSTIVSIPWWHRNHDYTSFLHFLSLCVSQFVLCVSFSPLFASFFWCSHLHVCMVQVLAFLFTWSESRRMSSLWV